MTKHADPLHARYILNDGGRFLDANSVEITPPPLKVVAEIIYVPHLAPLIFSVTVNLPGSGLREMHIRAAFTCHCFTEKWDSVKHERQSVIMDPNRPRVFDQQRYNLSKQLPEMVRTLERHKVYMTPQHRNYMAFDGRVVLDTGETYRMFFAMKRKGAPTHDLEMMVESAYPTNDPVVGMEIRFAAIVKSVFTGKKIPYKP